MKYNSSMKFVARLGAFVVYQIVTVAGSGLLLGGTEVWKSLVMACAPVLPVIAYAARAFFQDGKLTDAEQDQAFNAE